MSEQPIVVGEFDARRLRGLLRSLREVSAFNQAHLQSLRRELERAVVLESAEVPADVIRMRSRVQVRLVERGATRVRVGVPIGRESCREARLGAGPAWN